ncbi:MAG: hypothetical protein K6E62_14465 [Lachnospiraceae bacterium]|nr:hypothetical protein [Lachnospiraceae bacterium]
MEKKTEDNMKGSEGAQNDVVSAQEVMRFISRIIASGNTENIRLSLDELGKILGREGASTGVMQLIDDACDACPELAELGNVKKGADITSDELGTVLRESRERIRREQSYRC